MPRTDYVTTPERWGSSSYIGIAGASNGTGCVTTGGGIMCSNGVLPPNKMVKFADITDGTSNTLAVGEQSDWFVDSGSLYTTVPGVARSGGNKVDFRSSGLYGYLMGCNATTDPALNAAAWSGKDDCYNVTTVRYQIGYSTLTSGSLGNVYYGMNTALLSAHPGGAMGAFGDGSVRFLTTALNLTTLQFLSSRNDGTPLPGDAP